VSPDTTAAGPAPDRLGYTLYTVYRRLEPSDGSLYGLDLGLAEIDKARVTVRGVYDVTGMRADADVLVWLTGDTPEALQSAYRALRRVQPFAAMDVTWSAMGVHREAEFTRDHSPAFMKGLPPKAWITVYPFVRSYDWYLLPEAERRQMLADHGRKGSEMPQVQANTVASFALNDYEWILALEADELVDLVDLMRHLRNTEARRHVREEVPFFAGRRIEWDELPGVLS
jgi:chlorite dismutase